MAIYKLIQQSAFQPEDIERLTTAYEQALVRLGLDRTDPFTETIARRIIDIAQAGVKDPHQICRLTIEQLGRS
jgi:hypothetical protein